MYTGKYTSLRPKKLRRCPCLATHTAVPISIMANGIASSSLPA